MLTNNESIKYIFVQIRDKNWFAISIYNPKTIIG